MYELKVISFFSAAHFLQGYKGKCEAVHGHNWKVEVTLRRADLDHQGLVLDFKDVKAILTRVLDELDHTQLNTIEFFQKHNPSSENIARFIYKKVESECKIYSIILHKVYVWEQRDCAAAYFEDTAKT